MTRSAKEFRRIYGSRERVRIIQTMRCVICGTLPSENAHIKNGGMGRKAAWQYIVPLCHRHHMERDTQLGSNAAVLDKYGVDLEAVAERLATKLMPCGTPNKRRT